jgi:hypothetical protein
MGIDACPGICSSLLRRAHRSVLWGITAWAAASDRTGQPCGLGDADARIG